MLDLTMILLLVGAPLGVLAALAFAWLGDRRSFFRVIAAMMVYSALCGLTPFVAGAFSGESYLPLLLGLYGAIAFLVFAALGLLAFVVWRTKPHPRAGAVPGPQPEEQTP